MTWNNLIAILLLLPICWWSGITPLWTGVELAEHYVLSPEGSHCNEICVHPSSLVDQPQLSVTLDTPYDGCPPGATHRPAAASARRA